MALYSDDPFQMDEELPSETIPKKNNNGSSNDTTESYQGDIKRENAFGSDVVPSIADLSDNNVVLAISNTSNSAELSIDTLSITANDNNAILPNTCRLGDISKVENATNLHANNHSKSIDQSQDTNEQKHSIQHDSNLPISTECYPESTHTSNNQNTLNLNNKLVRSLYRNDDITTTEDEEAKFDEDADDKLDLALQQKLQLEYENNLANLKDQPLTPPENFAPVINKIYRSSFPQPNNFTFLKTLNLKSILCLIPEDYPHLQSEFLRRDNIKLFQLGMSGNKEPFVKISSELITEAAKIVLNPENQPILIHCNRGKHRTGCLVGVIRRLQNWSLTLIFDEYRKFAAPKERPMDQQFIELYDDTEIVKFAQETNLLPLKWQ